MRQKWEIWITCRLKLASLQKAKLAYNTMFKKDTAKKFTWKFHYRESEQCDSLFFELRPMEGGYLDPNKVRKLYQSTGHV